MNGVSVVIPTRGRPALVEALLESLAKEVAALDRPAEVIVVDDSDVADAERIRQACAHHQADYLRGPRRVGVKRNRGAAAARYAVVVFVDSDCRARPGLLAAHVAAHESGGAGMAAAAGPTVMAGDPTGHWLVMEESRRYNQPYSWPLTYSRLLWCTTSNLSVNRAVLEEIGGFDEDTFTVVGGEDIDLGVRIKAAGHHMVSAPDAVVEHARELTGLAPIALRMVTYGEADTYLCVRYPDRSERYLNPVSVALAVGLASVVTRSRWAAVVPFAALGAAVLARTARTARKGTSARRLPRQAVAALVDLSFDAGAVYGALRHRVPGTLFRGFRYFNESEFLRPCDLDAGNHVAN